MRNKPVVTITDKKNNIVFSFEYLNINKAKISLLENGFILFKKIRATKEEKDISKQVNESIPNKYLYKKQNKYFAELVF